MAFESFISSAMLDVGAAVEKIDDGLQLAQRKAQIDAATAGPSGDVHVEMESLVEFYNTLSTLHEELSQTVGRFQTTAKQMMDSKAGGEVAGVQSAWLAMTKMLGANGSRRSLVANLQAVDDEVLACMAALQHNAQQYAQNEEYAVQAFGRASGTGPAKHHSSKHHSSNHPEGHPAKTHASSGKTETHTGAVVEGGGLSSSTFK